MTAAGRPAGEHRGAQHGRGPTGAAPAPRRRPLLATAWAVYRKEIVDALRDRRTLLVVLVSSVLMGPLVLVLLSTLVANLEARAEQREVLMDGLAHAPTLVNYLQRQTVTVRPAPPDYEAALRRAKLGQPVVKVGTDFEAALRRGDLPVIEVVSDSANRNAEVGAARVKRMLAGFNQERATLGLALRGIAPDVLAVVEVQERDLASTQSRAAQLTGMLPFFVLMAVLYGALNAALDTTAGERERGSLEPLLANPAPQLALVLGKWGAVATVSFLIAVLACLGFIPAQGLLRSDALQAMFRFGPAEALAFLAVLLPFAMALSAVLMAVAIRCRSFKEAQANSTVVVLAVSLLPLITVLNDGAETRWHYWTPALAQHGLMTRVLKGEGFGWEQLGPALAVGVLLTALGVALVTRMLRQAAVR